MDDNIKYHQWWCDQVQAYEHLERESRLSMSSPASREANQPMSAERELSGSTAVGSLVCQDNSSSVKTRSTPSKDGSKIHANWGRPYLKVSIEDSAEEKPRTSNATIPSHGRKKPRRLGLWDAAALAFMPVEKVKQNLAASQTETRKAAQADRGREVNASARETMGVSTKGHESLLQPEPHNVEPAAYLAEQSVDAATIIEQAEEALGRIKPKETNGETGMRREAVRQTKYDAIGLADRYLNTAPPIVLTKAAGAEMLMTPAIVADASARADAPQPVMNKKDPLDSEQTIPRRGRPILRETERHPKDGLVRGHERTCHHRSSSSCSPDAIAAARYTSRGSEPRAPMSKVTNWKGFDEAAKLGLLTERNLSLHDWHCSNESNENLRDTALNVEERDLYESWSVQTSASTTVDVLLSTSEPMKNPSEMKSAYNLDRPELCSGTIAHRQALYTREIFAVWKREFEDREEWTPLSWYVRSRNLPPSDVWDGGNASLTIVDALFGRTCSSIPSKGV